MAILKRHPSIETARSLGDDMLAEILRDLDNAEARLLKG